MEDFIEKYNSSEGIIKILEKYTLDGIISVVADIFEVSEEYLSNVIVPCLGSDSLGMTYRDLITSLIEHRKLWTKLLSERNSNQSKENIFSYLRYWIMPDGELLKGIRYMSLSGSFSFDVNHAADEKKLVNLQVDDIGTNESSIQNPDGKIFCVDIGNALKDIWTAYSLMKLFNKQMIFEVSSDDIDHICMYFKEERDSYKTSNQDFKQKK